MPRVVPSQVVELIDQLFPQYRVGSTNRNGWYNANLDRCYGLQAVLDLTDQIPSSLVVLSGQDYSVLVSTSRPLFISPGSETYFQKISGGIAYPPRFDRTRRLEQAWCGPLPGLFKARWSLDQRAFLFSRRGVIHHALFAGLERVLVSYARRGGPP